MINISFYLNTQKIDKNGQSPVYMLLTYKGQRIRKAVKNVKVSPGLWNDKKGRVKPAKDDALRIHESFNSKLESLEEAAHKINKVSLRYEIPLTKEYILTRLENPESIELTGRNFFTVFQEYISTLSGHRAKRTLTGITTVMNFLKAFQNETKYSISFASIDLRFFEELRSYAFEKRGIANNYFLKIIMVLKAFMNWAAEREYHSTVAYKKFKVQEVEREVIYLTINELTDLFNYKFDSKRLSHVRDIYCFSCYTGLRFSDVISLNESHIQDGYVVKTIVKTGQVNNKIPLNKQAKAILDKYRDTIHYPLPKISNQKFNSYIKECCEKVGIDTPISIVRFSGGKRVETTHPKYELITSHTARKTFVTNSLILGMKEMIVRNITGHKKEESFKKYVKVAEDVKRKEMESTWDSI
ncbi:phage integrase SAM-like domain-containing protein [Ekhidna sp.]|uniref:site-specific integrase n=1 Tax=Ekhidna sp. TaxID=2608089 RepID=UPI003296C39E